MPSVYLLHPQSHATLCGQRLRVELPPDSELSLNGNSTRDIPLHDVERVVIEERASISTPALCELMRREIPVAFVSHRTGRVLGSANSPATRSAIRFQHYHTEPRAIPPLFVPDFATPAFMDQRWDSTLRLSPQTDSRDKASWDALLLMAEALKGEKLERLPLDWPDAAPTLVIAPGSKALHHRRNLEVTVERALVNLDGELTYEIRRTDDPAFHGSVSEAALRDIPGLTQRVPLSSLLNAA